MEMENNNTGAALIRLILFAVGVFVAVYGLLLFTK
jgi:hypothetical protein